MRLPSEVKIGSQIWTITAQRRKHSAAPDHYGWTGDKDLSIVIDSEMPLSLQRTTLFHELLHAVRFTFGGSFNPGKNLPYDELEHYFIGLYEEPVVAMLRENPELVAFLVSYDS